MFVYFKEEFRIFGSCYSTKIPTISLIKYVFYQRGTCIFVYIMQITKKK